MSRFPEIAAALLLLGTSAHAGGLGLGRAALPSEIAAWDKDVHPDGTGLRPGSGDVATGEKIFSAKCAACHGDFAEGLGRWPKLAGGRNTLADRDPVKTVGSYWPYLSTVWDYIDRSMPYGNAQSLTADEVYALVAYILYSNDLVDDDFVLSGQSFAEVKMPNADGFIVDDRAGAEYAQWTGEPCMTNCKQDVKITMRAAVLDVTPDTGSGEDTATPAPDTETASADPALIAAGEKVFRKCKACHQIGDGAKNGVGPELTGIVGRPAGSVAGFKYSRALSAMAEDGLVWDSANLKAFLANPRAFMKGTRMGFAGLKKDKDLTAIVAYLASFASVDQ